MTAWVTPRDWSAGEVVTESHLNQQVRDNEKYIKEVLAGTNADKIPYTAINTTTATKISQVAYSASAADQQTTSATYVDTTNTITLTDVVSGAAVLVLVTCEDAHVSADDVTGNIQIVVAGAGVEAYTTPGVGNSPSSPRPVAMSYYTAAVSGSVTVKLQFKQNGGAGTRTMYANKLHLIVMELRR